MTWEVKLSKIVATLSSSTFYTSYLEVRYLRYVLRTLYSVVPSLVASGNGSIFVKSVPNKQPLPLFATTSRTSSTRSVSCPTSCLANLRRAQTWSMCMESFKLSLTRLILTCYCLVEPTHNFTLFFLDNRTVFVLARSKNILNHARLNWVVSQSHLGSPLMPLRNPLKVAQSLCPMELFFASMKETRTLHSPSANDSK